MLSVDAFRRHEVTGTTVGVELIQLPPRCLLFEEAKQNIRMEKYIFGT